MVSPSAPERLESRVMWPTAAIRTPLANFITTRLHARGERPFHPIRIAAAFESPPHSGFKSYPLAPSGVSLATQSF